MLGDRIGQEAAADEFQLIWIKLGIQPVDIPHADVGYGVHAQVVDIPYQSLAPGVGQLLFEADFYSMHQALPLVACSNW